MKARVVGVAVLGLAGLVGSAALAAAPSAYPRPGATTRMSMSSTGTQANDQSGRPDVSVDGRYVAFDSDASNLVSGDLNGLRDVFWHDRVTGQTKVVSVDSAGRSAVGVPKVDGSGLSSISHDGRYVLFASTSANLAPGDTNAAQDVFLHDVHSGKTTRISISDNGAQGNGSSGGGFLSADNRYVVFWSQATNLVPGDTNGTMDAFVRDLRTGKTSRVSLSSRGVQGDADSAPSGVSRDGRYVVFYGRSTTLAPVQAINTACRCQASNVYTRDTKTGTTTLVSVATDGSQQRFDPMPACEVGGLPLGVPVSLPEPVPSILNVSYNFCGALTYGHAISDDGRYVTFLSQATNLVPNDTNYEPVEGSTGACCVNGMDVFVRDLKAHRTERLSVNSAGGQIPDPTIEALGSVDGRYATFAVAASATCAPGVTALAPLCNQQDVFFHDRITGATELVSVGTDGKPGSSCPNGLGGTQLGFSTPGTASGDGRWVSFRGCSPNLVGGDTNAAQDVLLRDRGPALGVGGLTGTQPPPSATPGCGLPVCPPLPVGAALEQARVIPRQGLQDLFIRWDLSRMAPLAGAPAGGLLYELRFTSDGQQYAVRAQRIPGADFDTAGGASFGLFRETLPGVWSHVASLKGGYGTVGDSVVTAVPLSLLGGSSQLTDVTAYTALGWYLSGPTKVLDSLRLSR